MAINFPDSPTLNQQFTAAGRTWIWDGSTWANVGTDIVVADVTDLTASATELNYVDGVTSAIQTQIDSKLSLSGGTMTGTINGTSLTLSGDLTVNGTTTNINTQNLVVEDKNVIIGDVATPTNTTADGGGITLKGASDKTLNWVDATGAWTSSEDFNLLSGKVYEINGTPVLSSTQVLGKAVPTGDIVGTSDSQTLTNKTLTNYSVIGQTKEEILTSGTGFAGYTYSVMDDAIQFITANSTANGTINFRGNASTTMNSFMADNQSVTCVLLVTNGGSAFYPNAFQIDGSAVTPRWQGGTAPTSGNANSTDVYTFTILKTASATYTVLASQTRFA